MSAPLRVQLRRTRGWRKPENTTVVARPTCWGNPHHVREGLTQARAVELFRHTLAGGWSPDWVADLPDDLALAVYRESMEFQRRHGIERVRDAARELRGRSLACWCRLCPAHRDGKPLGVECAECTPCHSDVLLEIANR